MFNGKLSARGHIGVGIIVIVCLAVIVTGFSLAQKNFLTQKTKSQPLKIGALLPLSGKDAEWGERVKRGMILAGREESGKAPKSLEIIFADSQSNVNVAIAEARKLINIEGVPVLFCQLSNVCSALAPIAQENKVVLLGLTEAPNLTEVGDYIFNLRGNSTGAGQRLGGFAVSQYKTIAIAYLNNPTHQGIYEGFQQIYEAEGSKILIAESHGEADTDFRTTLTKFKALDPAAILVSSRVANVVSFLKQAAEMGLERPIFLGLGIDTGGFLTGAGELAEGVIYPSAVVNYGADQAELKNALETYQAQYNERLPMWAAESYDGVRLLSYIVEAGANNAFNIKNALRQVKNFPGLSANISFDQTRAIVKEYQLFTVKNGQFISY